MKTIIGKIIVYGTGSSILQSKGVGKQICPDRKRIGELPNLNKTNCLGKIDKKGNVIWN